MSEAIAPQYARAMRIRACWSIRGAKIALETAGIGDAVGRGGGDRGEIHTGGIDRRFYGAKVAVRAV